MSSAQTVAERNALKLFFGIVYINYYCHSIRDVCWQPGKLFCHFSVLHVKDAVGTVILNLPYRQTATGNLVTIATMKSSTLPVGAPGTEVQVTLLTAADKGIVQLHWQHRPRRRYLH
jgi:hypothetical protein